MCHLISVVNGTKSFAFLINSSFHPSDSGMISSILVKKALYLIQRFFKWQNRCTIQGCTVRFGKHRNILGRPEFCITSRIDCSYCYHVRLKLLIEIARHCLCIYVWQKPFLKVRYFVISFFCKNKKERVSEIIISSVQSYLKKWQISRTVRQLRFSDISTSSASLIPKVMLSKRYDINLHEEKLTWYKELKIEMLRQFKLMYQNTRIH